MPGSAKELKKAGEMRRKAMRRMETGDWEDAQKDLATAVKLDPDSAHGWYEYGLVLMHGLAVDDKLDKSEKSRVKHAVRALSSAIDLDSSQYDYVEARAKAHMILRKWHKAQTDYSTAVDTAIAHNSQATTLTYKHLGDGYRQATYRMENNGRPAPEVYLSTANTDTAIAPLLHPDDSSDSSTATVSATATATATEASSDPPRSRGRGALFTCCLPPATADSDSDPNSETASATTTTTDTATATCSPSASSSSSSSTPRNHKRGKSNIKANKSSKNTNRSKSSKRSKSGKRSGKRSKA